MRVRRRSRRRRRRTAPLAVPAGAQVAQAKGRPATACGAAGSRCRLARCCSGSQMWVVLAPVMLLCCCHGCYIRSSSAGMPMPAACRAPPCCYSARPVVSKLAAACGYASRHRTAMHAGAARCMDADAVSNAPAGGRTPPANMLQHSLSMQVRSQMMPAAEAPRRRCHSLSCCLARGGKRKRRAARCCPVAALVSAKR